MQSNLNDVNDRARSFWRETTEDESEGRARVLIAHSCPLIVRAKKPKHASKQRKAEVVP